jgi:hypothetical protein
MFGAMPDGSIINIVALDMSADRNLIPDLNP